MVITVDNAVREYVHEQGGVLTLEHAVEAGMCCGRINLAPSVRLGRPQKCQDYTELFINETIVYAPKNFHSPYPLHIALGKFLWFRTLHVEGWKMI